MALWKYDMHIVVDNELLTRKEQDVVTDFSSPKHVSGC